MTNLITRCVFRLIALAALALTAGCGGDATVVAVQGVVTLDGKPVGGASVTFMPGQGGRPAFGITDADGSYRLSTLQTGDGARIGIHTVTIMAVDEQGSPRAKELGEEFGSIAVVTQPNHQPQQIWRIPQRYSEPETSGLEFEVQRGEENQADFALQTNP